MKQKHMYLTLLLLLFTIFATGCSHEKTLSTTDNQNGTNNNAMGGLSALFEDMIYFIGEGENGGETISAMTKNGENESVIYTPESHLTQISNLNTDGENIWFHEKIFDPDWLGVVEERICKYHLQSGESTVLFTTTDTIIDCLTLQDEFLYFTKNGQQLCRMNINGGKQKELCKFPSAYFIIHGNRIWCGPDAWIDSIISYNLDGEDRQIHYKSENSTKLFAVHNGYVYFCEYAFEDACTPYAMSIEDSNIQKLSTNFGRGCNPIGNLFHIATIKDAEIASNSDLTVTPSAEISGNASPGDITPEPPTEINDSTVTEEFSEETVEIEIPATHSDLVEDDSITVTYTPGSLTIQTYKIDQNGKLKNIDKKEYPGEGLFTQSLGCFSGNWRFYTIPEPQNGRTLCKEKLY